MRKYQPNISRDDIYVIDLKGPKWSLWSSMVPNICIMLPIGANLSQMFQNGPKLSHMFQMVPKDAVPARVLSIEKWSTSKKENPLLCYLIN